jgi:phosphoribosylglycinamide formyltransferase-1
LEWVERLRAHAVDTILLAGFMRVLRTISRRLSGPGSEHPPSCFLRFRASTQSIKRGGTARASPVHRAVTAGIDEGPILMQSAVPVLDDDTEASSPRASTRPSTRSMPAQCAFLEPFTLEGRRVRWLGGGTR